MAAGTTTDELGQESVIEYDYYYYYDDNESKEQGQFYPNDEYDRESGKIIDPVSSKMPIAIIPANKITTRSSNSSSP